MLNQIIFWHNRLRILLALQSEASKCHLSIKELILLQKYTFQTDPVEDQFVL